MDERELMAGVVDAAEKVLACEPRPETRVARAALALLRQRIHMLRAWQEESNEPDRPRHLRAQTCKYCPALVFFAVRDDEIDPGDMTARGSHWMPMEVDPIDSEGVLPEWRWVVNVDNWPPLLRLSQASTVVYVDHRQTCGNGDGPKKRCAPYERRYKANAAKSNAGMENESIRAANDLLALQRRLADNRGHDDS